MILLEFLCNSALINVHFLHRVNNNVPNLSEAVVGNSLFFSSRQEVRFAFLAFCLKLPLQDFEVPLLSNPLPCNWDSRQSTRLVASCLPGGAGKDTSFPQRP